MPEALLEVKDLHGWYGESHVLHGMSFSVPAGEVVTLLGRNGAGKTTTMRAVMGVLGKRQGSVRYEGVETIGLPSNLIARHGIAYCPEERGIFSSLSVRENLELPPVVKPGGMSLEEIDRLAKSPEIDALLLPLELGLADLPELPCTPEGAVRLKNGNPGMVFSSTAQYGDEAWASYQGRPVAVGIYKAGELHPSRVFNLD
jgi:ABC-type Fe3+/spermidine/putrescine transport system ATPase subunit